MDKFTKIEYFINHIYKIIPDSNAVNVEQMAKSIGLSKYHFIRLFSEFTGITPIQFLHMRILNNAKKNLRCTKTLLENTLELGLSSSSIVHNIFIKISAVTPEQYRNCGYNLNIIYGIGTSPFGDTQMAITSKGICFLRFSAYIDESDWNIKDCWKNAKLINNNSLIQEKIDNMFAPEKLQDNNIKLNLWNAILNLLNNKLFRESLKKKPQMYVEVAKIIPNFERCYQSVIQSGVVYDYRWGIAPKKQILLYQPIVLENNRGS